MNNFLSQYGTLDDLNNHFTNLNNNTKLFENDLKLLEQSETIMTPFLKENNNQNDQKTKQFVNKLNKIYDNIINYEYTKDDIAFILQLVINSNNILSRNEFNYFRYWIKDASFCICSDEKLVNLFINEFINGKLAYDADHDYITNTQKSFIAYKNNEITKSDYKKINSKLKLECKKQGFVVYYCSVFLSKLIIAQNIFKKYESNNKNTNNTNNANNTNNNIKNENNNIKSTQINNNINQSQK